jgi:hypothetical protein
MEETTEVAAEPEVPVVPTETVETKEEVAPVVETPVKPKKTAQERIDEITRARREAEREAAYWRKAAIEKDTPKPAAPESPVVAGPQRPKIEQFDTQEQYEDALFTWRDNVREIQTAQAKREKEHVEALDAFNTRAAKLREEHEDFDEVIESPVFSPSMRVAILQSENGPDLAYYLGLEVNRELASKIRNLSVERQLYEMGKLETNLLFSKQTKKVTNAPAPIRPVGMSGAGGDIDPSKMSTDEWMRWRKEQQIEKLKKKYSGG